MIKAQPRINGARLWQSLMELARIGPTPKGGVARLALTDLDREARDWAVARATEMGMTTAVDRIGNIFMRRSGRDPSRSPIMSGSHIGFSIDLRNADVEGLDRMDDELRLFIDRARHESGLAIDVQQVAHYPPCLSTRAASTSSDAWPKSSGTAT